MFVVFTFWYAHYIFFVFLNFLHLHRPFCEVISHRWLCHLGAAFTRFQTLRLQKVFPTVLADQLISYGSCQFPTLGFVVERYKQVQAFVAEPFWKIRGMTSVSGNPDELYRK